MWQYDEAQVARQAEMLRNRVRKRFAHLSRRFAREGVEAFRLYDWDIPEIRAVVDWYAGHLVIAEYERTQTGPEWLPRMASAVASALDLPMDRVHLKRRTTGASRGASYGRGRAIGPPIPIRERGLVFLVDLEGPLDTGLYPDHRDTRVLVRRLAAGTDFLNLFCYTGSFTCAAAAGGARRTVSVDRSATHLRRARANLEANALWGPAHALIRSDVFEFLQRSERQGERFHLVVVDPPSFFRDRVSGATFDVSRDHPRLLERVLAVAAPQALILFSTNHRRFEPRLDGLPLQSWEEITARTIPEDYRARPVHRCFRLVAR